MYEEIFLLLRRNPVRLAIVLAVGFVVALALLSYFRDRLEVYRKYLGDCETPGKPCRADVPYLLACIFAFALVVLNIFRNLGDFYVDYDTLGGMLKTFLTGSITLHIHGGRFFPLAHVDNHILTLATGGFSIVKYFLAAHLATCAVLLYFVLDWLAVRNRLILITLFLISPPIVAIYSSPIYLERNILFLVLIAMLFIKLAYRNGPANVMLLSMALYAIFVSLFLKEPTVVGIVIIAFASALRTIRDQRASGGVMGLSPGRAPLEFTMLVLCGLFVLSFFMFGGSLNPPYVERGGIEPLVYLKAFWPDALFLFVFTAVMVLRGKLDLYFFVFVAFLPLAIYTLKLLRDFDTFPYLNFALYMAFLLYVAGLPAKRFTLAASMLLITFVPVSWFYASRFHSEVSERAEVLQAVVDQTRKKGTEVMLDLESDYEEAGLSRYLFLRSGAEAVLHLRDGGTYCTEVISGRNCQVVDRAPAGAIVLTDREASDMGEPLLRSDRFYLYENSDG